MQGVLDEVLHDTLSMLPFLYLTYLFMEYLEHKSGNRMQALLTRARNFGPIIGAFLGVVPQCGFSVIASGLYINKTISLGTLIAVFVSTSDEAVPILISQPQQISTLLGVIIVKLIIAIISGYLVDMLIRNHRLKNNHPLHDSHKHCEEELAKHPSIFYIAFQHTIKVFIFIFIVNFVLTAGIQLIGEDTLSTMLVSGSLIQPVLSSIIGFIPNCAASILLAQLYVDGAISFGSLTAGLISSAGLGFLVLFKMYDNKRDIIRIIGILFLIASVSGILLQIIIN